MKLTVVAIALIISLPCSARAEACLDSARAVWATDPHAHPTWRLVDGRHCWHARSPRPGTSPPPHAYGMAAVAPRAIPLPLPRPAFELTRPAAYLRLRPQDGRALADELLPTTFSERWP